MRAGRDLESLAREITRQHESKRDYIADTAVMTVEPQENGDFALQLPDTGAFKISEVAHDQIGQHTKIPAAYYDRMRRDAPQLLANNIETWFKKFPAPRLVRTMEGRNRAFLSDRFRRLDNFDFANAALPILLERNLEIVSCEITEKKLYIKALDKQEFEVPVGYRMGDGSHKIFDVCVPAIIMSNSEIGFGRLGIETGTYTRACTNLCWFSNGGFKKTHVGARHMLTETVEDLDAVLSEHTKAKTDEAMWLQVRDIIKSAFNPDVIAKRVEQMEAAANNKIDVTRINAVMDVTAEKFGFNEAVKNNVLANLINGGNLTQYGLHAAITRSAQDVDDYDQATELEYVGGKVLELPRTDWKVLAEAA